MREVGRGEREWEGRWRNGYERSRGRKEGGREDGGMGMREVGGRERE